MRTAILTFAATAVFLLPAIAQQPPEGGPPRERRPPPAPKNLKLLEASEVMPTMRNFTQSLGVRCDHCHVQGDFASDDKEAKATARKMIELARDINSKFAAGKQHVTCYTCHHGSTEPATAPPAGERPSGGPPPPPAAKP